ncbi:hypothetical protein O0I10_007818 [Lichtheimia ornata]|uniref:BZIP domain-containing protein n=1 Tax=Lichtheimia ornata TaxID=688661 RepID=A0AAD7XVZ2_9FUNG|nr:uncharacterized protein O0I10_007818 [Lichtheimia ornata]KAJ8656495.1 hypothetical protein O0I10_007818 [Lichtheimia ornata]
MSSSVSHSLPPKLPPITSLPWSSNQQTQSSHPQHPPPPHHSLPPTTASYSISPTPPSSSSLTSPTSSEAILAEKRRRNAGASSRFRERRKQRERELQERVLYLEQRVQTLEMALHQYDPDHPQLASNKDKRGSSSIIQAHHHSSSNDLSNRVSQLETLMTRFRQEKETDSEKLTLLERENRYLKSLLESKKSE